ncbi:hypothetical protein HT746_18305 [Burkholderia pyrrocinia]|uniref:hypothetical protein n=1 Tax=Burkholderia pyrrocinia TaxID=60550 RepID=UPI001576E0B4|nr:hypothetical protein [Burkholderia pyrrocinia]NTX29061.1 hypothetical protein [Burkholderia pyrrocinia]
MEKKNARPSKAESSAKRQSEFSGTANPRHLRALSVLQRRPMSREELDAISGCSNAPDVVSNLRTKGLDLPCVRILCIDRDGLEVRRGVYHLTTSDRRKVARWLKSREAV